MKIVYINGYRGTQSNKPSILSQELSYDIKFIQVDYDNLNNKIYAKIEENIKDIDIVISSSTGSYLARKICEDYSKILVSYNPVIDIETTFQRLDAQVPKLPIPKFSSLNELIFVNEDDALIDYKNTLEKFKEKVKVFKVGGHRFKNIKETISILENYLMNCNKIV